MNEHCKTQVSSVYLAKINQLSENRAQRTFGATFSFTTFGSEFSTKMMWRCHLYTTNPCLS